MTSVGKFGLIFCLYLSQGVATSFLVFGVPSVLRKYGMPLDLLWVAYLPAILYSVKFLWAPLADRYWVPSVGRRRTWLIPSTLGLAASFLVLSRFAPDQHLMAAGIAFFMIGLAGANMDIATDAYAVDLLGPSERGVGNGFQSAGLLSGALVGRGGVLVLIDRLGWAMALTIIAILIPLLAAPGLVRREAPPAGTAGHPPGSGVSLSGFFRRPDTPSILLLAILTGLCYYLIGPIVGPFMVDAGLTLSEVGMVQGVVGTGAGIFGALGAGASVNRLGFRRAYLLVIGICLVAAALTSAVAASSVRGLIPLSLVVAAVNVALGGMFAVFYANAMNWCSAGQAATDFTAISSAFSLMAVIGGSGAAWFAGRFGYPAHFVVVALVAGVTLAAIVRFLPAPRESAV